MFSPDVLEQIKECDFVVALHSPEGSLAQLVTGWDAMLLHIKREIDPDGSDGFELPAELFNPDCWFNDVNGVPFAFGTYSRREVVDMCSLVVYRLHPIPKPVAKGERFTLGYGDSGYWKGEVSGGTTKLFDERQLMRVEIEGHFSIETATQFQQTYMKGKAFGQQQGQRELQTQLRDIMGIKP